VSETQAAIWQIIESNIPKLVQWWSARPKRQAVTGAAALMFWPDGMLQQLEVIAQGHATQADFKELRRKFKESKALMEEVITALKKSRTEIQKYPGGVAVVEQINQILFSNEIGKTTIRREIQEILSRERDLSHQSIAQLARGVCNAMHAFNAAVGRLDRLVNES
jgi:hypothetical protein